MFRSRPLPSDDGHSRRISSVVCSESISSSIFGVGGARAGGTKSTSFGLVHNHQTGGSADSGSGAGGGGGGAAARGAASAGGGGSSSIIQVEDAYVDADCALAAMGQQVDQDNNHADGRSSPSMAKRGRGASRCSNTLFLRADEMAAGGRQSPVKVGVAAETPAAWPPGGLREGEGLRINNLPDVSALRTVFSTASSLLLFSFRC